LGQIAGSFALPDLLGGGRLENSFFKVRIASPDDALSTLASPNSQGVYNFAPTDVHYSEAMAYYSVSAIMKYVESLGFSYVKTRPLFVMANATEAGSEDVVNAVYEHNYLNPSSPRTIKMIGNTAFAPGVDRDMYWHEMGHFANESISGEAGIDFAGDNGAIFTEGSALHECLADYVAESLGNKDFIGKWINRNFEGTTAGEPLRSAVDSSGNVLDYEKVARFSGGATPERYAVAEWCTRALWDLRQQFVEEDPQSGALFADRLVLSALSQLKKDTSLRQFHNELLESDDKLHCGLHSQSIKQSFSKRGFPLDAGSIGKAIGLQASPVGLTTEGETSVAPGRTVVFRVRLQNQSGNVARNVRLLLESRSAALHPISYQQGYGDLSPGATVIIGTGGLAYDFSVSAELSSNVPAGTRVPYRLRVLVENGETTTFEGELPL